MALPKKKHDEATFQEIRRRNAFSVRPPVQQLESQALSKFALFFPYFIGLFGGVCLIFSRQVVDLIYRFFELIDVDIDGVSDSLRLLFHRETLDDVWLNAVYAGSIICGVIVFLMALLIYWKKPRSRHHAAFLFIISLLVIVFGFVLFNHPSHY